MRDSLQFRGVLQSLWSDKTSIDRTRFLRLAFISVLGFLLAWQIISRSLVAYLAEADPDAALTIRGTDSQALLNSAESKLRALTETAEDPRSEETGTGVLPANSQTRAEALAKIRQQARTALIHDPLSARALRILGQVAILAKDEKSTPGLMREAAKRSLRQSQAVLWTVQDSYDRGDITTTLANADAIMRSRPDLASEVVPFLARIAETEAARPQLHELLASDPPWLSQFFALMPQSISDGRTPLLLLLELKKANVPIQPAWLNRYVTFLIQRKFHEFAYYSWLQFLPPEQFARAGFLFNGNFEQTPSGSPFDWRVTAKAGVTADFVPRPDKPGRRAFFIEFSHGRVDFRGLSQTTMLPPGTYTLRGQFKGNIVGRRGLVWRITCAVGRPVELAASTMFLGVRPNWTSFELPFTVPENDCRAQSVRLLLDARSASERLVTGSAWYDDLEITRTK